VAHQLVEASPVVLYLLGIAVPGSVVLQCKALLWPCQIHPSYERALIPNLMQYRRWLEAMEGELDSES